MRKITISTHVHFNQDVSICIYLLKRMKREFYNHGSQFNDLGILNQNYIYKK